MYKIYKIINTENIKVYIGYTKNSLKRRFANHLYKIKHKRGNCKIQRAFRKHGKNKFSILLLEECATKEEAITLEQKYINLYDSYKNGYNSTTGGFDQKISGKRNYKLSSKKSFCEKMKKWYNTEDGIKFRERCKEKLQTNNISRFNTKSSREERNKKFKKWLNGPKGLELREWSSNNIKNSRKYRYSGIYEVRSPEGVIYKITYESGGIHKFCKDNNLDYMPFYKVSKTENKIVSSGKNKGWEVLKWNYKE
jgi:group I intron endonuclease